MAVLANFPMKNQLSDTGEINREFDCVPTSIAACLEWLLKRPFDGGAIKDTVYGVNYQGGTAAANYVAYCKQQEVALSPLDGSPEQLVADIRFWIGQQQPLIATEPDPYANPSLGWTHVIAFYEADVPPGTLTCLDPYGGHSVTLSDAEWVARLQFNQVWKFERIGGQSSMPQRTPPPGWRDTNVNDPNGVLYCPGNSGGGEVPITGEFRDYILSNPWPNSNVALEEGHHVDILELSSPANGPCAGPGWQQTFRFAMLGKPDSGPKAGQVIFEWLGVELFSTRSLLAEEKAQVASLTIQVQQEQEQVKTLQQELAVHPDLTALANRLSDIGLSAKQASDLLAQVQQWAAQPIN